MDAAVAAAKNGDALEGPWALPEGWCWVSLGKLGTWTGGGTPSKANSAFWTNGDVPWVSPKDMKVEIIGETEDKITAEAVEGSSAKYVAQGSVLMVVRSGILKHSFPVAITDRIVTLNQDLRALTPHSGVCPKFVALYLALAANRVLNDCSKDGTTVDSIEVAALERLLVPLGPVAEQRRIVARVDALFAEITEGETALAVARKGLDAFRRALLKAAVTGELTKGWRAASLVSETGSDLLSHIKVIGNAKLEAKRRGRSSTDTPLDGSALPKLPAGWVWASLGELSSLVTDGDHNPPKRVSEGIPHITAKNIKQGRVTLEGCSFVSEEGYAQTAARYTPIDGDILITCVGTLGEIAIFKFKDRISVDRNIAAIRLENGIAKEFVELCLNSPKTAAELRRASGSTAQPHLYLKDIRGIAIPVPPPAEAAEIVRLVSEGLTAAVDTLAMLDAEAADAARLKQSILKAAFQGQLVPQNPADEPASALLARVATDSPAVRAKRGQRRKVAV